jgi:peptide/nickel transport system permease protein
LLGLRFFVVTFFRQITAIVGLAILSVFLAFAISPASFAPYDPASPRSQFIAPALAEPDWIKYFMKVTGPTYGLLGTDQLGRDFFSQIVYGARIPLIITFLAAGSSIAIGLAIGLTAGYIGGATDMALMRTADIVLTIPLVPLLIVLVSVNEDYLLDLTVLIIVAWWAWTARLVRSQVLSTKERTFVEAAKALGVGRFTIVRRHILPNVISLVFATSTIAVGYAVITQASLSFLGLENSNPGSWGTLLFSALKFAAFSTGSWWLVIPPGLCLALLVLSVFLIARATQTVFDKIGA